MLVNWGQTGFCSLKQKRRHLPKVTGEVKPANTGCRHFFLTYPNISLKFPIHGLSVVNMSFSGSILCCSDASKSLSAILLFLQHGEDMPMLSLLNHVFFFWGSMEHIAFWEILRTLYFFWAGFFFSCVKALEYIINNTSHFLWLVGNSEANLQLNSNFWTGSMVNKISFYLLLWYITSFYFPGLYICHSVFLI